MAATRVDILPPGILSTCTVRTSHIDRTGITVYTTSNAVTIARIIAVIIPVALAGRDTEALTEHRATNSHAMRWLTGVRRCAYRSNHLPMTPRRHRRAALRPCLPRRSS